MEEELKKLEEAYKYFQENIKGQVTDSYHPQYGWILVDGEITEAGIKFFKDLENK